MSTSSLVDERVFAEIQRHCYTGLDALTLHRRVLASLVRAIPFEGSCAHDADPVSGLPMRMHMDPPDEGNGRFFLEHVLFEEEVDDFRRMLRERRPVALLSETTDGHLERSLRYRAALAPRGFHFDLRAIFAIRREHWGGVSLFREQGGRDFNSREVALLGRLAPHVAAGLKAATLRSQALQLPVDLAPGVLILDARGRVVHYTASAERWLRALGDLGPDWLEGRSLPSAVWVVMGGLRRTLRPMTEKDTARVPRVAAQTKDGRWVYLHAALDVSTTNTNGASSGGDTGEAVIVIEPVGPQDLAWLKTAAYGLSVREQMVVDLVVRGASTKHIAAALHITEYTVQDHLSHIFDKVGVRGRRALIKQLYLDSVYSNLPHQSKQ